MSARVPVAAVRPTFISVNGRLEPSAWIAQPLRGPLRAVPMGRCAGAWAGAWAGPTLTTSGRETHRLRSRRRAPDVPATQGKGRALPFLGVPRGRSTGGPASSASARGKQQVPPRRRSRPPAAKWQASAPPGRRQSFLGHLAGTSPLAGHHPGAESGTDLNPNPQSRAETSGLPSQNGLPPSTTWYSLIWDRWG